MLKCHYTSAAFRHYSSGRRVLLLVTLVPLLVIRCGGEGEKWEKVVTDVGIPTGSSVKKS